MGSDTPAMLNDKWIENEKQDNNNKTWLFLIFWERYFMQTPRNKQPSELHLEIYSAKQRQTASELDRGRQIESERASERERKGNEIKTQIKSSNRLPQQYHIWTHASKTISAWLLGLTSCVCVFFFKNKITLRRVCFLFLYFSV